MTRRHFQTIADVLLEARRIAESGTNVQHIVSYFEAELAHLCARENPNFDKDRFILAARGPEWQTKP